MDSHKLETISKKEASFKSLAMFRRFTDSYIVKAEIGEGTYSRVFRCIHKLDGGENAIKLLPFNKVNFEDRARKARVLSGLYHPNLVRYYQSWVEYGVLAPSSDEDPEHDATLFIAMKSCPTTLASLLDQPFEAKDVLRFKNQLLYVLRYIHSQGVVHGDLKPANIFIDSGVLKITDFGITTINGNGSYCFLHDRLDTTVYTVPGVEGTSLGEVLDLPAVSLMVLQMAASPVDPESDSAMAKWFEDAWNGDYQEGMDDVFQYVMEALEVEDPNTRMIAHKHIKEQLLTAPAV